MNSVLLFLLILLYLMAGGLLSRLFVSAGARIRPGLCALLWPCVVVTMLLVFPHPKNRS